MASYISCSASGSGASGNKIPTSGTVTFTFSTNLSYVQGHISVYAINSYGSQIGQVDAYQHPSAGLSWEPWDQDGYPLRVYSNGSGSNDTFTINMSSIRNYFSSYSNLGGIRLYGSIESSTDWLEEYYFDFYFVNPTLTNLSGFSVVQNNDGTATFKWNACTGAYGSGGISYTIKEGTNGTSVWSGTATNVTLSISQKLWYGSSIRLYLYASYSGLETYTYTTKTFYIPSLSAPSSLTTSKTIGRSTTLSWNASKLSYTTSSSGITYTIYKDGASFKTTTSTSYEITEDLASTWSTAVTFTVKASATGLSNTHAGTTLTSNASNGVLYTYATTSRCSAPESFYLSSSSSYIPVELKWEGASNGVENDIIAYYIQYQDAVSDLAWPDTWIDLETDWAASTLIVSPPDEIGSYRKFRIQVKGTAGPDYYSDWLETDAAILRKDMAPFEGFTDSELYPRTTKIKAIHMTEMQDRINNLLVFNGKEIYPFSAIIAGQTKLSGWTNHVVEIREAIDQLKTSHEPWIDILDNRPSTDVMMQLRDVMNEYCKIAINVDASNGTPSGCIVTVRNMENNATIAQFEYTQPAIVRILPGVKYRVECSRINGYDTTPMTSIMYASANSYVSIELFYRNAVRYGYRRTKNNSDPNTRIEYLHDAVGMVPMSVDLTTGLPNYGSWKSFIDEVCRPVMLKSDGTVDYELNHDDQTLKIDGTPSDIANAEYDGNAMVEFRNYIWVRRTENTDYEEVVFSNVQYDNTYHAYANINESGSVNNEFYWGMYEGSTVNGVMKSISGRTPTSTQTATAEISQAQANGGGWYIIYKSGWDYIIDLLTLISKTDNSQATFGYGRTLSSNTAPLNTGSLVNKPAFCGYSNGTSEVKALYIEGLWGNLWERVAGLILNKTNGFLVKMTPPYNTTGSGYTSASAISGTTGNFISGSSCTDACGYLPKTLSGSADTYMCDKAWYSTSGVHYGLIGGRWTLDTGCGSRSMNFSELPTATANYTGTRISYINPT